MEQKLAKIYYGPEVDIPQVLISFSAIFGISLVWYDFNVKVFQTVRDLFSAMVYDKDGESIKPQDKLFLEKVTLCQKEEPDIFWREVNVLCSKMTTDKMEEGLKVLKKEPKNYLEDFDKIETILKGAHPGEEFDKWFDKLPCHLYIFYDTVMMLLWSRNWLRYTTALRDTGKALLL